MILFKDVPIGARFLFITKTFVKIDATHAYGEQPRQKHTWSPWQRVSCICPEPVAVLDQEVDS